MFFLSIIIPVFNVEAYLPPCLDSVLAQGVRGLEIILVDDCSTDGSAGLCEAYARQHPFIRVVHLPVNSGVSASRNHGITAATGNYILFLDSDDMLLAGSLAALQTLISERPSVDLVICRFISENGELSNDFLFQSPSDESDTFLNSLNGANYHPEQCWHYLINRRIIIDHDLSFIDVKIAEDQEFVARLLCRSSSIAFHDGPFYWYRERDGSLKKSYGISATASLLRIASALRAFSLGNALSPAKTAFIDLRIKHALGLFSARLSTHDEAEIVTIASSIDADAFLAIGDYFGDFPMSSSLTRHGAGTALSLFKARLVEATLARFEDIQDRSLVLYCTGPTGMAVLQTLLHQGRPVRAIFDDNPTLKGRFLLGVPVHPPQVLQTWSKAELSAVQVMVCHPRDSVFDKIRQTLLETGLTADQMAHVKF